MTSPLIRSAERVFILWGMADEPTWPARNPSVASSAPAISRTVVARLPGADASLDQRRRRRRGRATGGTPARPSPSTTVEPEVRGHPALQLVDLGAVAVEQVEEVLLGPDRPLQAPQRVPGEEVVEALERDQQLLTDVGEALAQRGGLGGDVVAAARHDQLGVLGGPVGEPGEDATARWRTSSSARRTCSCSTFSVTSRLVRPLWMCSWPARAQNSSMRAFTS